MSKRVIVIVQLSRNDIDNRVEIYLPEEPDCGGPVDDKPDVNPGRFLFLLIICVV